MSDSNDIVDCPVGIIRMLDIDRDFIYNGYRTRWTAAHVAGNYYGWPEFVREALLTFAAESVPQ